MALKVWLPLNGNLDNIGINKDIKPVFSNPTYVAGKIGQALQISSKSSSYMTIPSLVNSKVLTAMCWVKLRSGNTFTAYADVLSFQVKKDAEASTGLMRLECNTNANSMNWYANGNIAQSSISAVIPVTADDTWHHLALALDGTSIYSYVDGNLLSIRTVASDYADYRFIGTFKFGDSGMYCDLNDVRVYDHCLSALEVKEISQGLVLHYKLSSQKDIPNNNLFLKTKMTSTDRSGWVKNSNTDFTKLIRYYNGSTGIHSFAAVSNGEYGEYEDTVTLSTTGNLGIAFLRKATDINLDSNSYYTLSCEAKCNVAGKSLAIGTSYYTTGNSWVWRGGANAKAFSAVDTWETFTLTFKPDTNTQYICYCFTVNQGTANSAQKFTIRHCKLEKGSAATKWLPAPEELESNTSSNEAVDSSGYGNNGIILGNLENLAGSPRYGSSTKFLGSGNLIKKTPLYLDSQDWTVSLWYFYPNNVTSTWEAFVCLSKNNGADADKKIALLFNNGNANHLWCKVNSGSARTIPIKTNIWTHLVLTSEGELYEDGVKKTTISPGANLTGAYDFVVGARAASANAATTTLQYDGQLSDVRIYTTALSEEDILSLYHTSAHVDKSGKFHAFEFVENDNNFIKKNGIIQCNEIIEETIPMCQYDSQIYTEPDGSKWIRIYHHNNPGAGHFESTDSFATGVYKDANRWYDATRVCSQLNKWEFLIKYKFTSGGTEYKERWIQTKNPENAVYGDVDAADITRITTSGYKAGIWGGLYKKNESAYWVMNNGNSANWWGATGSFSVYQSGIPGYGCKTSGTSGTVTTTGFNDLYVRIDNIQTNARITKIGDYIGSGFIEK